MNWKKILLLIASSATAIGLLAGGFVWWRGHVARNAEKHALQRAQQLLKDGRAADALALVDRHPKGNPPLDWTALEISALAENRQIPRIMAWYEREPQRVEQDEDASLLAARAYLHARQTAKFKKLRQIWKAHERQPERWTMLDADAFMLAGQARDAERILQAATFPTNAEPQRLSRLAILQAPRDPNAAWNLLDRAYTLDPRNSDIRSFRAQLLESAGRPGDARVEYTAAHLAEPQNPMLRDQLADFFIRQRSYDQALQTWREAVATPTIEAIWLKFVFWARVVQPAFLENLPTKPPTGRFQPLTEMILELPPDRLFDTNQFNLLPGALRLAGERPEVVWLQILECLRTGAETNALNLLDTRLANGPTAPELSDALKTIIAIRLSRPQAVGTWIRSGNATNRHAFFEQLASYAAARRGGKPVPLAPETEAIVRGPNAFSAACLGAGWREAALQLLREVKTRQPEWFTYGIAQSLRFNRGRREALAYIAAQPPASVLTLLAAEIELSEGDIKPGLAKLETLAREDSDAGFRAAWLLSLADLDQRLFDDTTKVVAAQPRLATSSVGKELLARVALGQGKTNEADKIYKTIEKESIEAQTWLLRQDIAAKNFVSARRRAAALREAVPEALETRENQELIAEAEAKK